MEEILEFLLYPLVYPLAMLLEESSEETQRVVFYVFHLVIFLGFGLYIFAGSTWTSIACCGFIGLGVGAWLWKLLR